MARHKATASQATDNGSGQHGGETTAGYFRRLFEENPKLLGEKSNEKLLDRWLTDHPGHTEVPKNVRANLANLKSVLRSKRRKRGRPKKTAQAAGQEGHGMLSAPPKRLRTNDLETLEEQIDDCLRAARNLADERLGDVVVLLRKARNEVVWKIGQ